MTKERFLAALTALLLCAALGISGCDTGGGTERVTYTTTSEGKTYTLVITVSGDRYEFTVTPGSTRSEGAVTANNGTVLTLKPDNAASSFTVTVTTGGTITAVSGTVTFVDGTTLPGTAIVKPGSGGDGNDGTPGGLLSNWTSYTITAMASYLTMNTVAYKSGVGFIIGSGTNYAKPAFTISPSGEVETWNTPRELSGLAKFDSFMGKISLLNGIFLATRGSGVKVGLISTDGNTWTETSTIGFGTKGHAYGDGVYLVGGQHGQAAYSTDNMATWTTLPKETTTFDNGETNKLYINAAAYGVVSGKGRFVLGGGRGHTAYSDDKGLTWTGAKGELASSSEAIFDGPSGFIDCMIYFNGKFIALGGMDGQDTKSAYSSDGVNWTQGGSPGLKNSSDSPRMDAGAGYIVAVDGQGQAAYSTDGISWTACTSTGFSDDLNPIKDVAYGLVNGKKRFVIVGAQGRAAYCDIP